MISDKFNTGTCEGGQPVQGDDHAAAALAQGGKKSKAVPVAFGQKDQSTAGQKLTGR